MQAKLAKSETQSLIKSYTRYQSRRQTASAVRARKKLEELGLWIDDAGHFTTNSALSNLKKAPKLRINYLKDSADIIVQKKQVAKY